MKHLQFTFLLLISPFWVKAQFSSNTQVSIPVYFGTDEPSRQRADMSPVSELCGIAVMLFEKQDDEDNIMLSRLGDPVLWMEKVGISSRATFVFPETDGISEMEILLSNGRFSVKFKKGEQEFARGMIAEERGKYNMRLVGELVREGDLVKILDKVNNYLMSLHLKDQKKILLRPGFNEDTLNVICGYDTQFDTDFDVIWLSGDFYQRLKGEADKVHQHLLTAENLGGNYNEKVENSAVVEHTAKLSESDNDFMYGSIVILFEVMGGKDYYFLKGQERYQIAIDYFYRNKNNNTSFAIEKLMLRNVRSGDFVEMNTLDLTSSSIPIIYIDLINSVIMDDYGTWNLVQIFTVLEDIFSIIDLPNEKG